MMIYLLKFMFVKNFNEFTFLVVICNFTIQILEVYTIFGKYYVNLNIKKCYFNLY